MGHKRPHERRRDARDAAGQREEFVTSLKRKAEEEAAARPPKKPRDREKSWMKRERLSREAEAANLQRMVVDVSAREQRRDEEAVPFEVEMFSRLDEEYRGYCERREADRKRRERARWDEEIRVEAEEIWEAYIRWDDKRRLLPVNEIRPITICPVVVRCVSGTIGGKVFFGVIARHSGIIAHDHRLAQTAKNREMLERALIQVAGFPRALAQQHAARKVNDVTGNMVLASVSGNRAPGFSPLRSALESPGFRLMWSQLPRGGTLVLVIRGIDGFLVDIAKLRELYRAAAARSRKIRLCFYLNSIGRFYIIDLDRLIDDHDTTDWIVYLRRWLATIAELRRGYTPENASEWHKRYSTLGTKGRNDITNLQNAH